MLDTERAMAAACSRYREEVVVPQGLHEGRESMASTLEDLYVRRLQLPESRARVDALQRAIADPATTLIEIAHDGQLPHLGVVRMVLKARQIATLATAGFALYLMGDHYTAAMRPRNLYLGLPLRGVDADHVKTPFTVSVGKKNRHVPFHSLPPPSPETLDGIDAKAEAWIGHNASHSGRASAAREIKRTLRSQMEMFRASAKATRSFGDWLMRIQIIWLDALFDGPPDQLGVLPMRGILEWLPGPLAYLAEKVNLADGQVEKARQEEGREHDDGQAAFWIHCPRCRRRHRARWEHSRFLGHCSACGQPIEASWPEEAHRIMPDIIVYQAALFRAGIAAWVVGSRAPYHPVIERFYRQAYQVETPPKLFLKSVPRFRGLGEPVEGHTRPRLFRVLLELGAKQIREALEAPWAENPDIRSSFL